MNAQLIEFAQKTVAFVVLVFLFVDATAIAQIGQEGPYNETPK